MANNTQTVQERIVNRIYGKGRGWVFGPKHFLDLGPRKSVDMALLRLLEAGTIRRLARGLYDYPRTHPHLGQLSPSPESVARAIGRSDAIRLQPSGAYAANLLGLSTQVPGRIVYLTDGPEKTVEVGNQRIELKRTTPKNMRTAGRTSGLVIQAFRYLKEQGVTDEVIATLRQTLSEDDRQQLWKDRIYAPSWMHGYFREILVREND